MIGLIETSYSQTVRYVKPVASGTGNGSSWANASNDLQLMINNSSSGDEVWVSGGTYIPNRPANNTGTISVGNRNNAFVLKNGVNVYGGFTGNETLLSERNLNNTSNESILSGDFSGNDGANFTNMDENAYHVLVCSGGGLGSNIIFDGFTLIGAYYLWGTDPSGSISVNGHNVNREYGGALYIMHASPTISNITFRNNNVYFGGGLYIHGYNDDLARPTVVNCTFFDNRAVYGGAVCNFQSAPYFINSLIYNNRATQDGGAMYSWTAKPTLTNLTIVKNQANNRAGGLYHFSSSIVTKRNTIIFGNTATNGTGWNPQVTIDNSTANLFNNIIQNWTGGSNGNLNAGSVTTTDLFVNYASDNFRLNAGSVVVDAGNNTYISTVSTDLGGNTRIQNSVVDLGAFETTPPSPLPIELVKFDVVSENAQVLINWTTASERNNDFFTVEKSINGTSWSQLITVKGQGNSTSLNYYNVIDGQPYFGTSYYRLKQTDFDGKTEYFDIKSVNLNRKNMDIKVHPNPTSSFITVVGISNDAERVEVVNSSGIVCQTVYKDTDSSILTIDVRNLPEGLYFVRINEEVFRFLRSGE
ncbi:MAG: choice-of-anchor Q domain-containing protein [Crocinitomicaceae bacterium]|nr:choice-of-anchor Q domain-containing protein [Crocinitomicaceae bacterium]